MEQTISNNKKAPVKAVFNTGKTTRKGIPIWQAIIRDNAKDTNYTGSESEMKSLRV